MSSLPSWNGPAIARGPWLQLYLGSMSDKEVAIMVDDAKSMELPGVVFHGGPRSLSRRLKKCVEAAVSRKVPFALAVGVDGEKDSDGTRLTVEEKADALAAMDEVSNPVFVVVNAEITWDTDKGPDDDMDESGTLRMGQRFRMKRPNTIVIDQPWFAIDSHGEERKTAKPLGQGGTFAGFPSDEFASWVNARAPQVYFRNFSISDPSAYGRVMAWHHRDWAKHDTSLARLNLVRPRTYTLQGYGHHIRPQDFVHALLSVRDRPSIIWWDHEFKARWYITVACMEAVSLMEKGGHAPLGRAPKDCVASWQKSLGMPEAQVDGSCGWHTIEIAGLARRPAK